MGWRPKPRITPCPGCGGTKAEPRFKHWFSPLVRLECPCGVAGKWRHWDAGQGAEHEAAEGWNGAFGQPEPPMPPRGGSAAQRAFRCDACPDHPLPPRDFGGGMRL